MSKLPKTRDLNIVVQELEKEILIYDLRINKACCLNETSALIWKSCDGRKSVSEISRLISEKIKLTVPEDLVWLAIDNFKKENLLENGWELETGFSSLSRREVIRKIGFATMIALPFVSSVIAPTGAAAASGCVGTGTLPNGSLTPQITNGSGFCSGGDNHPQCQSQRGSFCCSGNARWDFLRPCVNPDGPDNSVFDCICVA